MCVESYANSITFKYATPSDTSVHAPWNIGSLDTHGIATSCPRHHSFQQDKVLPFPGQIFKICLDKPLSGPGSSHLSTTAPTSATKNDYLVDYSRNDAYNRCLLLSVFLIFYR